MIAYIPPMRPVPPVSRWRALKPFLPFVVGLVAPIVFIWAAIEAAQATGFPIFTAAFAVLALALIAFGGLMGLAVAEGFDR